MSPPSRRAVLQTCTLALAGGLAGCGGTEGIVDSEQQDSPNRTDEDPEASPESPTDSKSGSPSLRLRSEYDEEVTVRVILRKDGNRLVDETQPLPPGMVTNIEGDIPQPGAYTVEASFDSGTVASRDWVVDEAYSGLITAVVTADRDIVFREQLSEPSCPTADLPYAVPGAQETFSPSSATVQNESRQTVTVDLSVAHDGETFFSCTQPLAAGQSVSIDQLTATAGSYTVTADVSNGGQTVYDWRVPEGHSWPELLVAVPREGNPVVGCGSDNDIAVTVENVTNTPQTTALSLQRDGEEVAMDTVEVVANTTAEINLPTPVGDFYTLVAATDSGETQEEVVNCSCYRTWETRVTLNGSGPQIDASLAVCD